MTDGQCVCIQERMDLVVAAIDRLTRAVLTVSAILDANVDAEYRGRFPDLEISPQTAALEKKP